MNAIVKSGDSVSLATGKKSKSNSAGDDSLVNTAATHEVATGEANGLNSAADPEKPAGEQPGKGDDGGKKKKKNPLKGVGSAMAQGAKNAGMALSGLMAMSLLGPSGAIMCGAIAAMYMQNQKGMNALTEQHQAQMEQQGELNAHLMAELKEISQAVGKGSPKGGKETDKQEEYGVGGIDQEERGDKEGERDKNSDARGASPEKERGKDQGGSNTTKKKGQEIDDEMKTQAKKAGKGVGAEGKAENVAVGKKSPSASANNTPRAAGVNKGVGA